MNILQDNHGRTFSYLRLSVTNACNFRCRYCLPNGYQKTPVRGDVFEDNLLTLGEIHNLASGFASLGFNKIRLTGGEPTLRPDIVDIVRSISAIPGINTVALTTNGYRLDKLAPDLYDAGLSAVNVSLDSLDPKRFEQITGSDLFERVKCGLDHALRVGIKRVKVNVVLLKSFIERDFPLFLDYVRDIPISIRFIELMQTAQNQSFFQEEYYPGEKLLALLEREDWKHIPRSGNDGPARELSHPLFAGRFGIIAPYSKDFCSTCNRLRISSRGKLKLCLFGDGEYSLRPFLQRADQREDLIQVLRELIGEKPPTHLLHQGLFGSTRNLAEIGG